MGSAQISISGGTAPYQIYWNDLLVQNGLEVSGLIGGSYVVDVVDANGCESQLNVSIGQDDCPDTFVTQLTDEYCNNLNLDLNTTLTCEMIVEAEQFIWNFVPQSGDPILFYTTGNYIAAALIPNLQLNTAYSVSIKAIVDGVEQPYGEPCQVMFAPETIVAAPQLTDEYCGNMDISAETAITCTSVEGAGQYEWIFENTARGERFTYYSGSATSCTPSEIEGLDVAVAYQVSIRARINGQWTDYGQVCTIMLSAEIPTTSLLPELCGNHKISYAAGALIMEPIEGAVVYQFRIKIPGTNRSMFFHRNQNKLPLYLVSNLEANVVYTVDCRVLYNGSYGAWGEACEFGITEDQQLILDATIFPNPAENGETVAFTSNNSWRGLEIVLYNIKGNQIDRWMVDVEKNVPIRYHLPQLQAGIYLVQFRSQNQVVNKKLIIQ